MKKAKKILALLLCAVLLVGATVAGTLAYLKDNTETVTNTFVAAGGPGPFVDEDDEGNKKFELLEYQVTQNAAGKYTQTTDEVKENNYSVLPGTTIPKQAFVKLSRTGATVDGKVVTPAPAYLYIEVIDGLAAQTQYSWSVDSENWKELDGVTGPNDGKIYVHSEIIASVATPKVLTTVAADTKIDIITNDKITVADATLTPGEFTVKFNAFLAQASTGETDDPAAVFTACFLPATNP